MMSRVVSAIRKQLPQFNDDLLVNVRRNEVDNLVNFIFERYRECARVADVNLELINYDVASPIVRLNHELKDAIKKNTINIRPDESVLVNFNFKYFDHHFSVPLYVPYIYENSTIVVGGTRFECLLSMTEKLFSVRTEMKGVTVKVIRSPIACWRSTLHSYIDISTGEQFIGNIVTCKIHYKSTPKSKKAKPTVVHYLLCKFTLPEVLVRFGLPPDAATFVAHEEYDPNYCYFRAKNSIAENDQILLKVDRKLIAEHQMLHDITSAIVYVMIGYRFVEFDELIKDSRTIFMILLGKLIYTNNTNRVHALSYMTKHIDSVDTYLDNYTRDTFASNGVVTEDIYDLLSFIAANISQIIASYPNNNMYNKRIGAVNGAVIDSLVKLLYSRIYKHEREPEAVNHMETSIVKALTVQPRLILKRLGESDSVWFSPPIYSDNWLLSVGDKIVKHLTTASSSRNSKSSFHTSGINAYVNKFHPSMMVVESAIGFTSKPGVNCITNPYALIDRDNGFIKPDNAGDTDEILSYVTNDHVRISDRIDD